MGNNSKLMTLTVGLLILLFEKQGRVKMKSRVLRRGLLAGSVLRLLAAPVYPQGKKGGGGDKEGKTKYPFHFIFDGTSTLLQSDKNSIGCATLGDDLDPWAVTSGAGGTGNLGGAGNLVTDGIIGDPPPIPIPLCAGNLAAIADQKTCDGDGLCSARLEDPETHWVTFLNYENDPYYDVKLHFTFCVDCLSPDETLYTVQALGSTEQWNPLSPDFCQVVDFTEVRMWQYSPALQRRKKDGCDWGPYDLAPCEADWTPIDDFRAVIWRAEEQGNTPDCYP